MHYQSYILKIILNKTFIIKKPATFLQPAFQTNQTLFLILLKDIYCSSNPFFYKVFFAVYYFHSSRCPSHPSQPLRPVNVIVVTPPSLKFTFALLDLDT